MNLEATILIADEQVDIAPYVISLNRDWSLCNIVQSVAVIADPTLLSFLTASGIELKPSNEINVWEQGVKVFTGHVNTVKFQRKPEPFVEIHATDNYKFVRDFFIDESLGTSNGETVAYWIDVILTACGLSYTITSSEPFTLTVAPGIEFNLISADEALTQILAYSFSHAYVGTNGVVTISNGAKPSSIRFESGITTTYDDNDATIIGGGNVTRASHQMNDANTRNVVKVWGFKRQNLFPNESPYIQATASVDLGMPVDKTVLYSSSMIADAGTAGNLASRILEETGKFDNIKTVDCIGNPAIRIAQKVVLDIDLESEILTGTAKITNIHSSMSKDGYIMQVKMDEFCPKFAAWSTATAPQIFYAGTTASGVYKSVDGGLNWAAYNTGLPAGTKYVRSLAATEDDEVMAIINGQLWYTTSSGMTIADPTWQHRYLSSPNNDAGDNPTPTVASMPVLDSPGTVGCFNVLANYTKRPIFFPPVYSGGVYDGIVQPIYRSWVYETTDTGLSWVNTELFVDTPSGISYSLHGVDLSNRFSVPWVTTIPGGEENNWMWIYKLQMDQQVFYRDGFNTTLDDAYALGTWYKRKNPSEDRYWGILDWDFYRNTTDGLPVISITGFPGSRIFTFYILGRDHSGWPYFDDTYVDGDGRPWTLSRYQIMMYQAMPGAIYRDFTTEYKDQVDLDIPGYNFIPYTGLSAIGSNIYYPVFRCQFNEANYTAQFSVKFSFMTHYIIHRNDAVGPGEHYAIEHRVYSGEHNIVDLPPVDPAFYDYYKFATGDPGVPFGKQYNYEYPVKLTAGMIYINMDGFS